MAAPITQMDWRCGGDDENIEDYDHVDHGNYAAKKDPDAEQSERARSWQASKRLQLSIGECHAC